MTQPLAHVAQPSLLSDTQPIIGTYGPEVAHRRVIDVADRFRQRLVGQFNFTI